MALSIGEVFGNLLQAIPMAPQSFSAKGGVRAGGRYFTNAGTETFTGILRSVYCFGWKTDIIWPQRMGPARPLCSGR